MTDPLPCFRVRSFADMRAKVASIKGHSSAPVDLLPVQAKPQQARASAVEPASAPLPPERVDDQAAGLETGLCTPDRTNIYLAHDLGMDWKCTRCGAAVQPPAFR